MKVNVKQLLMVMILFAMSFGLFAQPAKRTTAYNYYKEKQYDKAMEAINEAIEHESTKQDPKTWWFRSAIYYDIAVSQDDAVKNLDPDPITKCIESAFNSIKYDDKDKHKRDVQKILLGMGTELYNLSIELYNNENYDEALKRFDQYFQVVPQMGNYAMTFQMQLKGSGIDPNNVYVYAGDAAEKSGDMEMAKKYYENSVSVKYDKIYPYLGLTDIYLAEGDTNKALEVIEKGKANIKDEQGKKNMTIKELLIYQSMGKLDLLTQKLEKALATDPDNANLYVTLGETYYQISSYHYIQSELVEDKLTKGMPADDIKRDFGDPSREEKATVNGVVMDRYYYGNKYLNFKDGKLDSWMVKTEDNINHAQLKNEYLEKAIEQYKTSLTKTDDAELLFALNSKIGTVYFNAGVDVYNKYIKERDENKLKLLETEYLGLFDKAVPFMEKAMEIKPTDKTHIDHLIKIYLLKQDMEKVSELNKLKNQ